MSAPSKGPWSLAGRNDTSAITYLLDADGHSIQALSAVTQAVACLIAAAPDLLAACKAAMECCGSADNWNGQTREFLLMMEAAVAKAEGRS